MPVPRAPSLGPAVRPGLASPAAVLVTSLAAFGGCVAAGPDAGDRGAHLELVVADGRVELVRGTPIELADHPAELGAAATDLRWELRADGGARLAAGRAPDPRLVRVESYGEADLAGDVVRAGARRDRHRDPGRAGHPPRRRQRWRASRRAGPHAARRAGGRARRRRGQGRHRLRHRRDRAAGPRRRQRRAGPPLQPLVLARGLPTRAARSLS